MSLSIRVVEVSLDETLRQLRSELKREFPETVFRVTRDRGTAYGYVSVRWEDGPPHREVADIYAGYAGTRYSCADDLEVPVRHLTVDGQGELVQVRHLTRGILPSRSLSPAWRAMYTRLVLELGGDPVEGPHTREALLAMGDAALLAAADRTRVGQEWLASLAWRASEAQEVVR